MEVLEFSMQRGYLIALDRNNKVIFHFALYEDWCKYDLINIQCDYWDYATLSVSRADDARRYVKDSFILGLIDSIERYEKYEFREDVFEVMERSIVLEYIIAVNWQTRTLIYFQANGKLIPDVMDVLAKYDNYQLHIVNSVQQAQNYAKYLDWESVI